MKSVPYLLVYTAVVAALAGCSQKTIDSAQHDTDRNVAVLNQKANQLAKEAKPQVDKISREVKPQIDKAGLGAKVQTALSINENLKDTHIRVDADTKGVRLRGTVKTPQQKEIAGRVARDTLGPDKTVSNELTLEGH